MADIGTLYGPDDFAMLLLQKSFSEKTDKQSAVMRDYLQQHINDFDRLAFNVRVGQGAALDTSTPASTQAQTTFVTQKRIDILGYRGQQPIIVEAKTRVDPSTLGQVLTYRQLWLEDNPDAPIPELVVIGRTSDDDTIRVLGSHGITVYLYETAPAE
jgi:hypothetical protein